MKKEIDSKLKEIKKENEKLYARIFAVSSLNGHHCYRHLTYDDNVQSHLDNQDLALLGDNILKLVISEYLYDKKYLSKGNLNLNITKIKEQMESNKKFSEIAKEFNLENYYYNIFPQHELQPAKKGPANFFEAIFGAFYLHFGFDNIKKFVYENIKYFINN